MAYNFESYFFMKYLYSKHFHTAIFKTTPLFVCYLTTYQSFINVSFVTWTLLTGDISIFTYINKLPVTGFSFCKTLVVNNVLLGNCKWVKYKVMNYSLTNRIIFSFKKCFLSTCNPYGQKSLACCSPCSYVDLDTV